MCIYMYESIKRALTLIDCKSDASREEVSMKSLLGLRSWGGGGASKDPELKWPPDETTEDDGTWLENEAWSEEVWSKDSYLSFFNFFNFFSSPLMADFGRLSNWAYSVAIGSGSFLQTWFFFRFFECREPEPSDWVRGCGNSSSLGKCELIVREVGGAFVWRLTWDLNAFSKGLEEREEGRGVMGSVRSTPISRLWSCVNVSTVEWYSPSIFYRETRIIVIPILPYMYMYMCVHGQVK